MSDEIKYVEKPVIDRSMVNRAYIGRQGCMCGCKGTYYEDGEEVDQVLHRLANAKKVELGEGYNEDYYILDYANGKRYAIYAKKS